MSSNINLSMVKEHPAYLAKYYTKFNVANKLLFTGHSHQAWPDCSLESQIESWNDAAMYSDDKWERAFYKAEEVRKGFKLLLEDTSGCISLGTSTHELLIKFLSGLDFANRPKIITTDGEFHTVRRQLNRLKEDNYIELITVPCLPASDITTRIIPFIDDKTSTIIISSVYFENGHIVENFECLLKVAEKFGTKLLIDVYHSLNVVPFSLKDQSLDSCFIIGGGYKYCQLGEGNAFLRFPSDCMMRPVITGWFSEWEYYYTIKKEGYTLYGKGDNLFSGSTYDPTSHYRGARIFQFFNEKGLNPHLLRKINQHQMKTIINNFDDIDANPKLIKRNHGISIDKLGGFLALESPIAEQICYLLKQQNVFTDYRGNKLRFGPAPYTSDIQIHNAMQVLKKVLSNVGDSYLKLGYVDIS